MARTTVCVSSPVNQIRFLLLFYRISTQNVMKIREFARDANWTDISAACDRFIIDNFEEVSREDKFYKTISKTDFANFLTLDELTVWDEETICRSIEKWAQHRGLGDLEELCSHIRIDHLKGTFLKEMSESESPCKSLIQTRFVGIFNA